MLDDKTMQRDGVVHNHLCRHQPQGLYKQNMRRTCCSGCVSEMDQGLHSNLRGTG